MTAGRAQVTLLAGSAVLAASLALASGASAYRQGEGFDRPAIEGGGGGRHFTGSRYDGYTCGVCHSGGSPPEVSVELLDTSGRDALADGYLPGQTYDLMIEVPAGSGAAAELTDDLGSRGGSFALPPTPGPGESCMVGGAEVPATHSFGAENERQVLAMDGCGAERLAAAWVAPAEPSGTLHLDLAVVSVGVDGTGTPDGDGVFEASLALPLRGTAADGVRVGSSCAAWAPGGASPAGGLALWVALLVAARRRAGPRARRRRRARAGG